jgi:hypothetical protein
LSIFNEGRNNATDIKIGDISVSRQHAAIKLINGEFFIEDLNSKFGTLLEVKHDFVILDSPAIFQAGKMTYKFELFEKKCQLFKCLK